MCRAAHAWRRHAGRLGPWGRPMLIPWLDRTAGRHRQTHRQHHTGTLEAIRGGLQQLPESPRSIGCGPWPTGRFQPQSGRPRHVPVVITAGVLPPWGARCRAESARRVSCRCTHDRTSNVVQTQGTQLGKTLNDLELPAPRTALAVASGLPAEARRSASLGAPLRPCGSVTRCPSPRPAHDTAHAISPTVRMHRVHPPPVITGRGVPHAGLLSTGAPPPPSIWAGWWGMPWAHRRRPGHNRNERRRVTWGK